MPMNELIQQCDYEFLPRGQHDKLVTALREATEVSFSAIALPQILLQLLLLQLPQLAVGGLV